MSVSRRKKSQRLLAVVGLAAQDAERPVQLLDHEEADEAMRDRQLAKCNQLATTFSERVAVAVGAADDEHERSAATVLRLGTDDVIRELHGRHRLAALVERVDVRVRGE